MNKTINKIMKSNATKTLKKNSNKILTGLGVLGIFVSAGLTAYATYKSMKKVEEINKTREEEGEEPLTKTEVVKECWPNYVAPAATAIIATGCVFGSDYIVNRRFAAMEGAYFVAEKSMRKKLKIVDEVLDDDKKEKIHNRCVKEATGYDPVDMNSAPPFRTDNRYWCTDLQSGHRFLTSFAKIDMGKAYVNNVIREEDCCSWSDFANYIGQNDLGEVGNLLGWHSSDFSSSHMFDVKVDYVNTKDGTFELVLDYHDLPRSNYEEWK